MPPVQASKKANEKEVYSNLQERRVGQQPNYKLGQLVRTADIKKYSQMVQIDLTKYIHLLRSYTILYLAIESTIYPRKIIKTYCYQQN